MVNLLIYHLLVCAYQHIIVKGVVLLSDLPSFIFTKIMHAWCAVLVLLLNCFQDMCYLLLFLSFFLLQLYKSLDWLAVFACQVHIFYCRGVFASRFSEECLPHQIQDYHNRNSPFLRDIKKGDLWGWGCIRDLYRNSLRALLCCLFQV